MDKFMGYVFGGGLFLWMIVAAHVMIQLSTVNWLALVR